MEEKIPQIVQPILDWQAPAHAEHEHTTAWYVGTGVILLGLIAFSLATRAWTFTVVIAMMAAFYGYTNRRKPGAKRMTVYPNGFVFDGERVSWQECGGYFMLQGRGYIELHVERAKPSARAYKIQIGAIQPSVIRQVFGAFLPELPRQEKIFDAVSPIF